MLINDENPCQYGSYGDKLTEWSGKIGGSLSSTSGASDQLKDAFSNM
jgi:hypothetical protein